MPIQKVVSVDIVIPVKPGKTREYAMKFKRALEDDITRIDALIDHYNQAEESAAQKEALAMLEREAHEINRKYADDLKRYFPDYYEKMHRGLFREIQVEHARLNPVVQDAPLSFPEYLEIMPIEKAERMLRILLEPDFKQEKLAEQVFDEYEPGRDAFLEMLSRYEISVLGGGNSKNFTVLDLKTRKSSVLKAENRMSMPKDSVVYLRARSMQDVFTEDMAEREVMCTHPVDGKPAMRTLLFTEFHPAGSLKKHSEVHETDEERVDAALDVYLQMTTLLRRIERDGCCFPDMKNGNWLVDALGKLRIADKKSFIYTRAEEIEVEDMYGDKSAKTVYLLDLEDEKNTFYSLLYSKQMAPAELSELSASRKAIDASKMHAYMIGKNLYQYLTKCPDSYFFARDSSGKVLVDQEGLPIGEHNVGQFDFSAPVFKTPKGQQLERLIKSLIYTSPEHVNTALEDVDREIAFMQYPDLVAFSFTHEALVPLKIETYQMLKDVERFKINATDSVMNSFVEAQRPLIENADKEADLLNIQKEIKAVYTVFESNQEQHLAIQGIIRRLKSSESRGLVQKGNAIEAAYLRVPLHERGSVADGKTETQKAVLDAMQREVSWSRRLGSWFGRQQEPSDEVKETFVRFKNQFETGRSELEGDEENSLSSNRVKK